MEHLYNNHIVTQVLDKLDSFITMYILSKSKKIKVYKYIQKKSNVVTFKIKKEIKISSFNIEKLLFEIVITNEEICLILKIDSDYYQDINIEKLERLEQIKFKTKKFRNYYEIQLKPSIEELSLLLTTILDII